MKKYKFGDKKIICLKEMGRFGKNPAGETMILKKRKKVSNGELFTYECSKCKRSIVKLIKNKESKEITIIEKEDFFKETEKNVGNGMEFYSKDVYEVEPEEEKRLKELKNKIINLYKNSR